MFRLDLIKKIGWGYLKMTQRQVDQYMVDQQIAEQIDREVVIAPQVVLMSKNKSFRSTILDINRSEITLADSLPLDLVRSESMEVAVVRKLRGQNKQQIILKGKIQAFTTPFTKISLENMTPENHRKITEFLNSEVSMETKPLESLVS